MVEIVFNKERGNSNDVFNEFYSLLLNVCKDGVKINGNCIFLDNEFLSGQIDFIALNEQMALYRFRIIGKQRVIFKIDATKNPEYYSFVFSLKEIPDQHKFNFDVSHQNVNSFGATSSRSVYYSSSNVQSYFSFSPGIEAKIVFIRYPLNELNQELFSLSSKANIANNHADEAIKGYTTMNAKMLEEINSIFDYNYLLEVKPYFFKGVIYKLAAMLINEISIQDEKLISESGIVEAARIMQLKNLVISDFSKPCPKIEDMAKKACMSLSKFQSTFKELFGMPYYQYYQHHRLIAAKNFLALGMSVKDTAFATGFANPEQLTIAFKKKFNLLPSKID